MTLHPPSTSDLVSLGLSDLFIAYCFFDNALSPSGDVSLLYLLGGVVIAALGLLAFIRAINFFDEEA